MTMGDDPIDRALENFGLGFTQGAKPSSSRVKTGLEGKDLLDWKAGVKAAEDARAGALAEYARYLNDKAGWPLSPAQVADGQTHRHCDDYIHDHHAPLCLRAFLLRHRVPAIDGSLMEQAGFSPLLFATLEGQRVKVIMASRFGDVGITSALDAVSGYDQRVSIDMLTNFSHKP